LRIRVKPLLLAIFLSFVNVMIILRGFIFNPGLVFYRDLRWPLVANYFKTIASYVWNPFLQLSSINTLNQAPMHMFLSLFNPLISERLIFVIIIIVATMTSFYVTYKLTRSILGAIVASIVFVYNPVVINRFHHKFMVLSYSLLPLTILISHRMAVQIRREKSLPLWYIITLSILLVFISHSIHFIIFTLLMSLIVSSITLYLVNEGPENKVLKLVALLLISYIITIVLYLAMEAFFILPLAVFILNKYAILPYVLNVDELYLLNRNNYLINILRLSGYWWPSDAYSSIPFSIKHVMYLTLFVYPSIFIAAFLMNSRNDKELKAIKASILLIALIAITFAGGIHTLRSIYLYIVLETPIGWILRDPYKLTFILALCYSLLSGIVVSEAEKVFESKSRYISLSLCSIFILLVLFGNIPLLTGNLGGVFTPVKVNTSYGLCSYGSSHSNYYHWIVYPPTPWYPTVFTVTKKSSLNFVMISLLSGKTCSVIKLLNSTGIKFLAFRKMLFSYDKDYTVYMIMHKIAIKLSKELHSSVTMKTCGYSIVTENNVFSIYKILGNSSVIKTFNRFFIALGGDLYTVYSLLSISKIPLAIGVYDNKYLSTFKIVNSVSGIVIKSSYNNIELDYDTFLGEKRGLVLAPSMYTYYHDPNQHWSRGFTYDPLHGEWHPYLNNFNIINWQSDYGYGLVFTWAQLYVPSSIHPSIKDLVIDWSFNKQLDCDLWRKYTPRKQFRALQTVECHNGVLIVKLYNSTWGWKTVRSPLIPINPSHTYFFVIRIRGINAHGVHIKLAEFNARKRLIDIKYIRFVGDGTFNWKVIKFSYIPSNPRIRYIQIQIWHGHLTNKPLPNIVMIDYVKVYDVTKYAKHVVLSMPFIISRSNYYKIFVRYFENERGGAIRIYLDGKLIAEINTVSQLNRFVWRDLGTFNLEAGRHVITLENVKGFNAVNVFVLIPVDEYNRLVKELETLLKGKRIIYIFEAESDMFRSKARVVKDLNASNGELLYLEPGGSAWQSFEVLKSGYYIVAVKVRGTASILLDGKRFNVSSSNLAFRYIGPIYLARGTHTIRVEALQKPVYLDVVWIYSVKSFNSRTAINELFKVGTVPARVVSYERINPTLWKVRVNAKRPFMLVFAESYDPLWEARVYKGGKLIERVRSIPIYGTINGFWINATGNLTIIIRYLPQDWFELGAKISIATFALCIFYLVWDWRRSRGDRWAISLENSIRKVLGFVILVRKRSKEWRSD